MYDECILVLCLFFKQKTAYEMRISDWSSDVCSSDLRCRFLSGAASNLALDHGRRRMVTIEVTPDDPEVARVGPKGKVEQIADQRNRADGRVDEGVRPHAGEMPFRHAEVARFPDDIGRHERSEEQTSELQSLMRISSAVFCLKKK